MMRVNKKAVRIIAVVCIIAMVGSFLYSVLAGLFAYM